MPFSFGSDIVNQGSRAQIFCAIQQGDPPFAITWSMHGQDLSSDVNTAQLGTSASMLSIESVDYHHSGEYTCMASNQAGATSYTATLRVNGRQHTDAIGSQALDTLGLLIHPPIILSQKALNLQPKI